MSNAYGLYKDARNSAWRVLIDYRISSAPVDVVKIANLSGIDIVKNKDVEELRSSEVGVSILDGEQWYIVYDDSVSIGRIRFTIAHELGHIFLGHPIKAGYYARTIDSDGPGVETQADMFAIRLLAPSCVIWGLDLHTADEIEKIFKVSRTAAEIRAKRMTVLYKRNQFLASPLERVVFENFHDYIHQHRRNEHDDFRDNKGITRKE